MRDSLTVLAILLIGLLTAALVGPYVVDWTSQRAVIERRLTAAAGTPVVVSGPIDVKLLPTPRIRFADVRIGDVGAGHPRLTAAALDAEISLTALMRGQVQIVDTTLLSPRLDLQQSADGSFDLAMPSDGTADRVAVDHLGVRDGAIRLTFADGRHVEASGLDLDGEATSLRGPFKVQGRLNNIPFRLATGAVDRGRLRVKIHLDGQARRPSVDLDGTVAQRPGPVGPGFDGTAALSGTVPLDTTSATIPWTVTARLSADRGSATATEVEARAGTDLRALIARGEGQAAYAGDAIPTAGLRLQGPTFDADALAVPSPEGSVAPPTGADLARSVLHGLGLDEGAGAVSLPWRVDLKLGFDTATIGGRTLPGLEIRLGLGPEPTAALTLVADGPQGSRLSLDGRLDPGPARTVAGAFGAVPAPPMTTFRGRADLRSNDLARSAAWLAPLTPRIASALAVLPGRDLHLSADVEASAMGVVGRDVALSVGGSSVSGRLSYVPSSGPDRARLFADLSSESLVIDRLPDPSATAGATRDVDVDLSLAARTVTVTDPGPFAGERLDLHLTKTGDDLTLRRLRFDIDGATVDGTADRNGDRARATVHVSASRIEPLARALGSLVTPSELAALRARSAALSPLDATLSIDAAATGADRALVPLHLSLDGTAGGTRVAATVTPGATSAGSASADDQPLAMTVKAEASEALDLLRQLGLPVPSARFGAARLVGEAHGSLRTGFAVEAKGALGETSLDFKGHAAVADGTGRLSLTSSDVAPVSNLAGIVVPAGTPAQAAADVGWDASRVEVRGLNGTVAGSRVTGTVALDLQATRDDRGAIAPRLHGALAIDRLPASALVALALGSTGASSAGATWSTSAFSAPPTTVLASQLSLKVADMPLRDGWAAKDVAFDLTARGSAVTMSDAVGSIFGGAFGGSLTLRRDPGGDSVSGQVAWTDVGLGVGGLSGRLGGRQEFSATGVSPAALVAGLAGRGSVTLRDVDLARTDPAAPSRVLAAIVARDTRAERVSGGTDVTPTDPEAIRRDLMTELDRGALRLGDADLATRLLGGVLRTASLTTEGTAPMPSVGKRAEKPPALPWSASVSAVFDLGTLTLSTGADLRGAASSGGAAAAAAVTRTGAVGQEPVRAVDVSALVEAVQAQAIARAQDRIDIVEQDIRERAAFNRQWKAMQQQRQAEQERVEAERKAAAAQAAADVQAKADAARAAADARKAEAARRRADSEAAARASAAEAVEKQRFFDDATKGIDPSRDRSGTAVPQAAPAFVDPPPPPSIIR